MTSGFSVNARLRRCFVSQWLPSFRTVSRALVGLMWGCSWRDPFGGVHRRLPSLRRRLRLTGTRGAHHVVCRCSRSVARRRLSSARSVPAVTPVGATGQRRRCCRSSTRSPTWPGCARPTSRISSTGSAAASWSSTSQHLSIDNGPGFGRGRCASDGSSDVDDGLNDGAGGEGSACAEH
jgi:hypothetical protein